MKNESEIMKKCCECDCEKEISELKKQPNNDSNYYCIKCWNFWFAR